MALVVATQKFVMEGYTEVKERSHWWSKPKYVRKLINCITWETCICDDSEAEFILEQKIKEKIKNTNGWGRNFEGWTSYRKFLKPGESYDWPDGGECKMRIDYIRDWKMEKIIKVLDANQFAKLCKELQSSIENEIAKM